MSEEAIQRKGAYTPRAHRETTHTLSRKRAASPPVGLPARGRAKPERRSSPKAPQDPRPIGKKWQHIPTIQADWRDNRFRYRMSSRLYSGLPDEMKLAVRAAAKELGISMSELVRRLISREITPR